MSNIPGDVTAFLRDYPTQTDDPKAIANLKFYGNELRCQPDRVLIEKLHADWFGDYATLETNHGYIQWLFPLQECGMNFESQPLQKHEREAMRQDPKVAERLLTSFNLMLDFYGFSLQDNLLTPTAASSARWRNLVSRSHNNLRITRILKCLGEFSTFPSISPLPVSFLLGVLLQQGPKGPLAASGLKASMERWWINCLKDEEQREWVAKKVQRVWKGKEAWTRQEYEDAIARLSTTGSLKETDAGLSELPAPRESTLADDSSGHTKSKAGERGSEDASSSPRRKKQKLESDMSTRKDSPRKENANGDGDKVGTTKAAAVDKQTVEN